MQKPLFIKCTRIAVIHARCWAILSLLLLIGQAKAQTFKNLEKALENPDLVINLNLSKDKLKEVPPEIKFFKNLESLNLSKNHIEELPQFLAEMPSLQTLILSKNKLRSFPEFLSTAPQLQVLVMDRNPIDSLPAGIAGFHKLTHLDLWDTDLEYISPKILETPALEYLDVRNTYFKTEDLKWLAEALPELELKTSYGCNCD